MHAVNFDMRRWKQEAIRKYRDYMNRIDTNSDEYRQIAKGLEEFEKIVL